MRIKKLQYLNKIQKKSLNNIRNNLNDNNIIYKFKFIKDYKKKYRSNKLRKLFIINA